MAGHGALYQPPTGPDHVVESDWLYERPDGATVPAPQEAWGVECGKVTPLWDLFLVPVPEVPKGKPQGGKGDVESDWLHDLDDVSDGSGRGAAGSHDCESDNYEY